MSGDVLTTEEIEYYDNCKAIYRELNNTKLYELLNNTREKIIHKIANSENDRDMWINVGRLKTLDDLLDKKLTSYNEVKRMDALQ